MTPAPKPREATSERTTGEEFAELLPDGTGQAVSVAASRGFPEEGLAVLQNDGVEHGATVPPALELFRANLRVDLRRFEEHVPVGLRTHRDRAAADQGTFGGDRVQKRPREDALNEVISGIIIVGDARKQHRLDVGCPGPP